MNKSIIIAAAASAFFFAVPAFAQDCPTATAAHVKVFSGATGAETRAAPTRQATGRGNGFDGPHGSATNLRDAPSSDPTTGRGNGFDGPNGSASNLRDAPRPTQIPDAKLSCRKTGGDGADTIQREIRSSGVLKPLAAAGDTGATQGLTKVGAGTLTRNREPAPRMQSSNNLKQMGIATNH